MYWGQKAMANIFLKNRDLVEAIEAFDISLTMWKMTHANDFSHFSAPLFSAVSYGYERPLRK